MRERERKLRSVLRPIIEVMDVPHGGPKAVGVFYWDNFIDYERLVSAMFSRSTCCLG